MDLLPGTILQNVLAKADAKDCARAACIDRRWRQSADDDSVWKDYCCRDFALSSRTDPHGNPCPSYKETYTSWQKSFGRFPPALVVRAKQCWDTIKDWLNTNFTDVLASLNRGVSWDEIEAAEQELGFALPDCVRVLYQICNGQNLEEDKKLRAKNDYLGLFGGYRVYDHYVNVRLLPLRKIVAWTPTVRRRLKSHEFNRIVIATSFNFRKWFFLDCDDGLVYVGTRNQWSRWKVEVEAEMLPCVPVQERGAQMKDGMLRWLENYGRCLQSGMYGIRDLGSPTISLFPLKEPLCKEAITHGLQVKCSAVFVPEMSGIEVEGYEGDDNYMFAYSVRMRLLQENNTYCNKVMESAQLAGRHWVIRVNDEIIDEVRGEAVIGEYPWLQAGGEEYVYESRSAQHGKTGSMEGDFTFVPGRLSNPEGGHFAAYIPRFSLQVPDYIY